MKLIFTSFILVLAVVSALFLIIHFSNRYKSAFEADQECHSQILLSYSENSIVDCDHDIETRQWILFEKGVNEEKATVLQRFRY